MTSSKGRLKASAMVMKAMALIMQIAAPITAPFIYHKLRGYPN